MMRLFVHCAVIVAAIAFPKYEFEQKRPEKSGCCLPAQFEGIEGIFMGSSKDGKTHEIQGYAGMHYDFRNKRVAMEENVTFDGKEFKAKIIQDYNTETQYVIQGKKCYKQTLPGPMVSNCFLKNATKIGEFYMGMDDQKMQLVSYAFKFPELKLGGTITVTKDKCVPIGEQLQGNRAELGDFMASIGFVNLTNGIHDPSVFNIPAICKKSEAVVDESGRIRSVLGM